VVRNKRILYFIQLPPPVHGVSALNQIIVSNPVINEMHSTEIVELLFSYSLTSIRVYNVAKIVRFFNVFFSLRRKLKKYKPDLVYFSFMPVGPGFFRDFIFLLLIRQYKTHIILHLNNRGINKHSEKPLYHFLYRYTFLKVSVIHVSEGLMNEELRNYPIPENRKFVLNNTCERIKGIMSKLRETGINILFLSNIFPEKGIFISLEAFRQISANRSDIRLHIYGQTLRVKYVEQIMEYITLNGLSQKVFYHGPADQQKKLEAFSMADIYIFPSCFSEECMPLSLLEAMQAGLPVVASGIGAIPEMIIDSVNGLLVKPGNTPMLAEKITLLVENRELRITLGEQAKISFEKKYSPEKFEAGFSRIIEQVLSE
jgi:glycosyltransferase involved in cell wall biosynthesis